MTLFRVDTDDQPDNPDQVREFLQGLKKSATARRPMLVLSKIGLKSNFNLWKAIAVEEGFEVLVPPPGVAYVVANVPSVEAT